MGKGGIKAKTRLAQPHATIGCMAPCMIPLNQINPNSEMKNAPTQSRPVGARRLRRFSVRMVLDGRKVQPGCALKRPQGRAPVVLVNSTSEFGINSKVLRC